MAGIPFSKALKDWEAKHPGPLSEAKEVLLYGGLMQNGKRVFLTKLDAPAGSVPLRACERLSMSTNQVTVMVPGALAGMERLRILSLARNQLKRVEGLIDVAGSLEELWLSYNLLASLDGLQVCTKLRVLYLGNNQVREWAEVDRLTELPALRELLLTGNPLYDGAGAAAGCGDRAASRSQVLKRLPSLAKLDNELVLDSERAAATAQ